MAERPVSPAEERRVVAATSVGTVFEWYDFYLYATLAPFFAELFFPGGNAAAALLSAFATYAAGFLVRPFGALFFGRLGDLIGRKYTFLATILVMGAATFLLGLLPTYAAIGWGAPVLLVGLRLLQGLALGGEYGGAAIYVAEHVPDDRRGYKTGWVQTTATLGFFLALVVIGLARFGMDAKDFAEWGWRIPFLVSILLLIFSVYIRLRLHESPVFERMKAEARGSRAPLTDSFLRYPNNKRVLLALFGVTAGQGVVWYTGQFYALFFLTLTLQLDYTVAYALVGGALLLGAPLIVFFGWLSDRIGRLKIILAGCLLAAVSYFPLFQGLAHYVNPALEAYSARTAISVTGSDCGFHLFVGPWSRYSDCDRARDFLAKQGLSFAVVAGPPGTPVVTRIGDVAVEGWSEPRLDAALKASGYPGAPDRAAIDYPMALLMLFVMMVYVAMAYGPVAAYLVELFPTPIRYTSMSLPYHIGNGWFGGMLPLTATAMVAATGDIYYGLWYPVAVAAMSLAIGALFLRETLGTKIH